MDALQIYSKVALSVLEVSLKYDLLDDFIDDLENMEIDIYPNALQWTYKTVFQRWDIEKTVDVLAGVFHNS